VLPTLVRGASLTDMTRQGGDAEADIPALAALPDPILEESP